MPAITARYETLDGVGLDQPEFKIICLSQDAKNSNFEKRTAY